jgi:hypothetical protein
LHRWAIIAIVLLGCGNAGAGEMTPTYTPRPSAGRITLVGENDALMFEPTDYWYTHGHMVSYLSPPLAPPSLDWLFPPAVLRAGTFSSRRFEIVAGQSIFTPKDKQLSPPDPTDRPYAGWLYAGVGLYQETNRYVLDHLELLVGVVGPASLA